MRSSGDWRMQHWQGVRTAAACMVAQVPPGVACGVVRHAKRGGIRGCSGPPTATRLQARPPQHITQLDGAAAHQRSPRALLWLQRLAAAAVARLA
jgi:hypothetical protein